MVGMRDEEMIAFFAIVFGAVVVMVWMRHAAQLRQQRLQLLESALRNNQFDEHTKRELVKALGSSGFGLSAIAELGPIWCRRLFMSAGWITMVTGLGMLIFGSHWQEEAGGICMLVGFGILSLPIVIRELEGKRQEAKS